MSKPSTGSSLTPRFTAETVDIIHSFLKQKLEETGASGVIIGLSGGLDSAVVTQLCSDALGPERVLCLIMPESTTAQQDIADAIDLASGLGVEYRVIDITNTVQAFRELLSPMPLDAMALGNIKARTRMITLYVHANLENRLVMGTSNKSELATGYFTKFGDGGADFSPIGDLYKTQVFDMAKTIGIPENQIQKPPAAGLAPDQTDEDELGLPYHILDRILLGIELKLEPGDISKKANVEQKEVERIQALVRKNVHKRKMPLIPKIGIRTFGLDWRE